MKKIVLRSEVGTTLSHFLAFHLGLSNKKVKKILDHSCCLLNGKVEKFSSRVLLEGDLVECLSLEFQKPLLFDPEKVIYEDDYLMVYNKPVGLSSDGDLGVFFKQKGWILVHRLDKETSGLLLFAKEQIIFEKFVSLFEKKQVQKKYLAWIQGEMVPPRGKLITHLGKGALSGGRVSYKVTHHPRDLLAETRWETLNSRDGVSLVAFYPITGRTHQLRVHAAHLGHPILGDTLYHPKGRLLAKRLLLHAEAISFPHPVTEKLFSLATPPPSDFHPTFDLLDNGRSIGSKPIKTSSG